MNSLSPRWAVHQGSPCILQGPWQAVKSLLFVPRVHSDDLKFQGIAREEKPETTFLSDGSAVLIPESCQLLCASCRAGQKVQQWRTGHMGALEVLTSKGKTAIPRGTGLREQQAPGG